MIRHSLFLLLSTTALGAASVATGCISPTVIGGNGEGGAGGAGTSVVTTGVSPNTAIAQRTVTANGDVYRVTVSNFGQACPEPTPVASCPTDPQLSLTFDVPADVQAGDTLNAEGFFAVEGQQAEGSCWGGGGTAFVAVEVLSADGGSLTLRLTSIVGTTAVDLEGTYNAPICGGQPLANALAVYRYDLGGGESTTNVAVSSVGSGGNVGTSVTSGTSSTSVATVATSVTSANVATSVTSGGSSNDDLFLVVGNEALVCEDPFGAASGCQAPAYRVAIALPPGLQQPGYYPLSGIATFSAFEPDGSGGCMGGGGSYWDGFVEVLYVGADQIVFSLSGTGPLLGAVQSADGTYAAPLCSGQSGTSVATVGSGQPSGTAQATVGAGNPSGGEAAAVVSVGTGGN